MGLIYARNDALEDNGPQAGDQQLTEQGSSWLFAVTALYFVSLLAVLALSFRPRFNEKIFHYIFAVALFVGTIAYFAQASGLAYEAVAQANQTSRGFSRQIHWAKYVNWIVSFPVVTMALGLLSGVSFATILFNVALCWIWIVSWLCGAFVASNYKWAFFIFGLIAVFMLVANISLLDGRAGAARVGVGRDHTFLGAWVAFLWLFMYPLAWGLSDGGNRIGVVGAWIWFGILDLLLIPVMAFGFIFLSSRWDYGALNLHFTQYGRVRRGTDLPEKSGGFTSGAATGAAAGAAAAPGTTTTGHHGVGHHGVGHTTGPAGTTTAGHHGVGHHGVGHTGPTGTTAGEPGTAPAGTAPAGAPVQQTV